MKLFSRQSLAQLIALSLIPILVFIGCSEGGGGGTLPDDPPVNSNRIFEPTKFNRYIDQEAHEAMERLLPEGIAAFAFHPDGGWVIATLEGSLAHRGIPDECRDKLQEFLAAGHTIQSIAFPPRGGNSWVIVTDRAKYARYIPEACNQQLEAYMNAGESVLCVAFPPNPSTDDSWVIITENSLYAQNIDDEAYQLMRNLFNRPRRGARISRRLRFIGFNQNDGWVILGDDYFYSRNAGSECFEQLNAFSGDNREIAAVAFDPDGNGWSIISNERLLARRPRDEIERFESNVGGKSIWNRMRDYNVPGVSVAVVVDNRMQWSTGYGHLAKGEEPAVHPESLFQAASISKVLTAIGMHKLVDEGLIELDDDIQDYLSIEIPMRPCLSAANPGIRLIDVLQHKSSVMGRDTTYPLDSCADFDGGGGGYGGYDTTGYLPTLNQIIEGSWPANSPAITRSRFSGTYSYSGPAFTLLQKLVKDLTTHNFDDWMEAVILKPMAMNDSYFRITLPQKYFNANQVAAGYDANGNPIVGVINDTDPIERRRYPELAAAGLYSTAEDLAQAVIMLNNDGKVAGSWILSQESRDNIALNGIGVNLSPAGFTANNRYYTHGGTNEGFRSVMVGFPDIGTGVVVMTNGDAGGSGFRGEIAQAVIDAYGW